MNNTFIGFLKSFINLAITIASIVGAVILYTKLLPFIVTHIIIYTILYLIVALFLISFIDDVTKNIFSRNYINKKEMKELADYVIKKAIEETNNENSEESNNIIPINE